MDFDTWVRRTWINANPVWRDAARAAWKAAQPPAAPERWRLVPVTPTKAMIDAGGACPGMKVINDVVSLHAARQGGWSHTALGTDWDDSAMAQAYTAMLAAAPQPETADSEPGQT